MERKEVSKDNMEQHEAFGDVNLLGAILLLIALRILQLSMLDPCAPC